MTNNGDVFEPRADWMNAADWTDNEVLSMALMVGRGLHPEPFADADIERFAAWANQVRTDLSLIQNVLQGITSVVWRDNQWHFALTEKGVAFAEQLKREAQR